MVVPEAACGYPGSHRRKRLHSWRPRISASAFPGDESGAIDRAFQAGIQGRFPQAALVDRRQCTLSAFDASLGQLTQASPAVKRELLAAAVACIAADGKTTLEEDELLRAIAAAMGCPVPPVVLPGPR